MANLIPPDAKKAVALEYWLRVVTVWFVLIGFGLIAVALLKVPTYVLVYSQLRAYSGAYDEAVDKTKAFDEAQATIEDANDLAFLLTGEATTTPLSEMVSTLDTIGGAQVRINDFNFNVSEGELSAISVSGVADTRIALADFSKDIEGHPWFAEAELPISNLAKDRDIGFNITITPATE